jgi:HSP20 family molecular chaperone IbpA
LLIIEGSRDESNDELTGSKLKYLCMERGMKRFRRVLKIPVFVNTTSGKASYFNGVLTIRFPKLKGKLIKIMIERNET